MNWMDFAYWFQLIDEFRARVLGFEPAFLLHESGLVRAAFIFIVVRFSLGLLIAMINTGAVLAYAALSLIASAGARWLIYSLVDTMADIYIQFEAIILRLRAPSFDVFDPADDESPTNGYEEEAGLRFVEHEPLDLIPRVAREIVMHFLIIPLASIFLIVAGLLRGLSRITISNIAALVITLWLIGSTRNLSNSLGNVPLGHITVSAIVASGTLLALLFVALNTDVRGKAELNKVASLACRMALHESTAKLLRLAEALAVIRVRASKKLRYFPTAAELFDLTGRNDLYWRGSRLLPLAAVPRTGLLSSIYDELVENYCTLRWPCEKRRSILVKKDVADQLSVLKFERKTIRATFANLRESGMDEKLRRVLNRAAYVYLDGLRRQQFKLDIAPCVYFGDGNSWYDRVLGENGVSTVKERWVSLVDATPNDRRLRKECKELSRLLQSIVYDKRSAYWQLALDEYRLRYLAETIDSSLRPRLLDRIRQLFDK